MREQCSPGVRTRWTSIRSISTVSLRQNQSSVSSTGTGSRSGLRRVRSAAPVSSTLLASRSSRRFGRQGEAPVEEASPGSVDGLKRGEDTKTVDRTRRQAKRWKSRDARRHLAASWRRSSRFDSVQNASTRVNLLGRKLAQSPCLQGKMPLSRWVPLEGPELVRRFHGAFANSHFAFFRGTWITSTTPNQADLRPIVGRM
jgi:hypothetical protein